jgi:hypothetical protein
MPGVECSSFDREERGRRRLSAELQQYVRADQD